MTYYELWLESTGLVENLSRRSPSSSKRRMTRSAVHTANLLPFADQDAIFAAPSFNSTLSTLAERGQELPPSPRLSLAPVGSHSLALQTQMTMGLETHCLNRVHPPENADKSCPPPKIASWSANGSKLAVCTADRLFDEEGGSVGTSSPPSPPTPRSATAIPPTSSLSCTWTRAEDIYVGVPSRSFHSRFSVPIVPICLDLLQEINHCPRLIPSQ